MQYTLYMYAKTKTGGGGGGRGGGESVLSALAPVHAPSFTLCLVLCVLLFPPMCPGKAQIRSHE